MGLRLSNLDIFLLLGLTSMSSLASSSRILFSLCCSCISSIFIVYFASFSFTIVSLLKKLIVRLTRVEQLIPSGNPALDRDNH